MLTAGGGSVTAAHVRVLEVLPASSWDLSLAETGRVGGASVLGTMAGVVGSVIVGGLVMVLFSGSCVCVCVRWHEQHRENTHSDD